MLSGLARSSLFGQPARLIWATLTLLFIQSAVAKPPGRWFRLNTAGPDARSGAAIVFDGARDVLLLHGGKTSQAVFSDTWSWNGTDWKREATGGPAWADSGIAYDEDRGVVVLFGGANNLPCDAPGHETAKTWTWNGADWALASDGVPPSRCGMSMVYDRSRRLPVLYGGVRGCGDLPRDTYEWEGSWKNRQADQPGGLAFHRAWFDPGAARVRFFGGSDSNGVLDGMWEWDGTLWTDVTVKGPPARQYHALAYVDHAEVLVLFGGYDNQQSLGDTWLFDGVAWTKFTLAGPPARHAHAMAYDPIRDEVVLFGGTLRNGERLGDTWVWTTDFHGDLNCDWTVDFADINAFVLALGGEQGYNSPLKNGQFTMPRRIGVGRSSSASTDRWSRGRR